MTACVSVCVYVFLPLVKYVYKVHYTWRIMSKKKLKEDVIRTMFSYAVYQRLSVIICKVLSSFYLMQYAFIRDKNVTYKHNADIKIIQSPWFFLFKLLLSLIF